MFNYNIKSKYFSHVPFGAFIRPMLPNQGLITNYPMGSAQVFAFVMSILLSDKYLISENNLNEIKLISWQK